MTSDTSSGPQLKILMVGSQMALAGAQRVLLSQATWFHQRGNQVSAVFFYDKQGLKRQWSDQFPFPVIDLQAWDLSAGPLARYLRLTRGLLRLFVIIRRGDFDVVEAYTPHSNMLAMVVAAFARVPARIATHHGVIEGMPVWLRRLHGFIVNSAFTTCMVAVSDQVKEMAVRLEGVREQKVVVINNGIEIQSDHADLRHIRDRIYKEHGLPEDVSFLLAVGRLEVQKGHTYLLDAAPSILARHPRVVFAIAGVGDLERSLREKCRLLGLEQKVLFLGNRSNIFDYYAVSDIFLMPSVWEGLPIAMLEAMSQGVPVVVSDVEGVRPVIEHGRSGLIIPSKDSIALVDAVDELLSDPEKMQSIGRQGRQVVRERFSIEVMCSSYLQLFLDCLPH